MTSAPENLADATNNNPLVADEVEAVRRDIAKMPDGERQFWAKRLTPLFAAVAKERLHNDDLRRAIFGGSDYEPLLTNGCFVEMAHATEAGRKGALDLLAATTAKLSSETEAREKAERERDERDEWVLHWQTKCQATRDGEINAMKRVEAFEARALTAEAALAKAVEALKNIEEHPATMRSETQSYGVGWAFWNVQDTARRAVERALTATPAPAEGREAVAGCLRALEFIAKYSTDSDACCRARRALSGLAPPAPAAPAEMLAASPVPPLGGG